MTRRLAGAVVAALLLTGCVEAPAEPTAAAVAVADARSDAGPMAAPGPSSVPGPPVAPAPTGAPELRASSVARVSRQLTVRVRSRGCGRLGTASGVALAPRLLVTNRHVVSGADTIELNYWDGTSATASVLTVAVADDLALVRVSVRLPTVARLAQRDARDGAAVVVAGFPNGGRQTVGRGRVVEYARLRSPVEASPVMRLTATVVPGNSGGAVVDERGELVGVVFGVETETGYGLAIPASAVEELVSDGGTAPSTTACS